RRASAWISRTLPPADQSSRASAASQAKNLGGKVVAAARSRAAVRHTDAGFERNGSRCSYLQSHVSDGACLPLGRARSPAGLATQREKGPSSSKRVSFGFATERDSNSVSSFFTVTYRIGSGEYCYEESLTRGAFGGGYEQSRQTG